MLGVEHQDRKQVGVFNVKRACRFAEFVIVGWWTWVLVVTRVITLARTQRSTPKPDYKNSPADSNDVGGFEEDFLPGS